MASTFKTWHPQLSHLAVGELALPGSDPLRHKVSRIQVTFTGLLFTVLTQEAQQKKRYLEELCPCFAVVCNSVSAKKSIPGCCEREKPLLACTDTELVRDADVHIINVKANAALNVLIRSKNNIDLNLGYIGNTKKKVDLILNATKPGEFFICFEDVCGNKYKQKIKYEYDNTECHFHSSKVEGVRSYEKEHQ